MDRELIIVPNKDILDVPPVFKKLKKGEHHSEEALNFLHQNNILRENEISGYPPKLVAGGGL